MKAGGNFIQQKCKNEQSCTSMPPLLPLHKLLFFSLSSKANQKHCCERVPDEKVKFFCGGACTHTRMLQGKGDFGPGTEIPLDTNIE